METAKNYCGVTMKLIENKSFDYERALYGSDGIILNRCTFEGEADGESALKESEKIEAKNCIFKLRYPFWHDKYAKITDCKLEESARAPLWYSSTVEIYNTEIKSPKALRECKNVYIDGSQVASSEFGWECYGVTIKKSQLSGEYFMLGSKNVCMTDSEFSGKYSFQYVKKAKLENCRLDTKDAFWHAENVTVKNCYVKGEYLGWYSKNLTLENCVIIGTQPFCYAKGLKLINCEMHDCDLAFEKSEVVATVTTKVVSIKNPKKGKISCLGVDEIINDLQKSKCKIIIQGEKQK